MRRHQFLVTQPIASRQNRIDSERFGRRLRSVRHFLEAVAGDEIAVKRMAGEQRGRLAVDETQIRCRCGEVEEGGMVRMKSWMVDVVRWEDTGRHFKHLVLVFLRISIQNKVKLNQSKTNSNQIK